MDIISYTKAKEAQHKADIVQSQLDQAVAAGDQLAETQQARVGKDGTVYSTLNERLNAEKGETEAELQNVNSQLMDIAPLTDTTDLVSSLNSYVGFVNHAYPNDNGTRLYILPRDTVTTGVGGVIKIFGDAYHLQDAGNLDYRDLGIYFSVDQSTDGTPDRGSNNTGVFWINQKVFGPSYSGENPDIGFSFQDGAFIAGRFCLIDNNRTVFVVGKGNPLAASISSTTVLEAHGSISLRNTDNVNFLNATGTALHGYGADNLDFLKLSSINGVKEYVAGVLKKVSTTNSTRFDHAVVENTLVTITNSADTTPSVINTNTIKLDYSSPVTITNFDDGQSGQRLIVYITNANVTLQQTGTIKLANAVNFTSTGIYILEFQNINGIWFEVSRTKHHT